MTSSARVPSSLLPVLWLAAALVAGSAAAQGTSLPPAPAPARALDVSALEWTVAAPRIILGETTVVEVKLTARRADGTPLDVAPPRLSASTGSVGPPQRQAPGVWTATFTPPAVAFPHVAILFATIDTAATSAVGFIPLHLWGKGQTTVRTKPGSRVTVFIGNESFGPVAADEDGAARVPIVVPPGPERAMARSVDAVGNESQKTIDLGVPPFNRLALLPLDDVASADGAGEARLLAFVVDKKGQPLYEARFAARASVGEVDPAPVGLSPGMFKLGYRPGKAPRGEATVEVTLEGDPGSVASATVRLLSGRVARARIDAPRATLGADEPRAVVLDVRLFDPAGNAVPAGAATVDVDVGRIEEIAPGPDGGRKVTWVLPAQLPRPGTPPATPPSTTPSTTPSTLSGPGALQQTATLTVRAPSGEVLGTCELVLLPGRPARLALDPLEPVVADGQRSVEVRLRVSDAAGNPLVPTGAALAVPPEAGELLAATVDDKVYRARFVPASRDRQDLVVIQGTLGSLKTKAQVRLLPRSRARLLVGLGVVAGTNYGSLAQAGPDLSLLVRLPGFDGAIHAGLSVSLLQSLQAPAGVDHRSFPLLLEGAWRPLVTPELTFHLGGGLGVVLTDELAKSGGVERRTVLPGAALQAVAGLGYRLGPGFLEVDGRVGSGLTFPEAAVGAPLGAGVVLGYRFGI